MSYFSYNGPDQDSQTPAHDEVDDGEHDPVH